jgi:hypothetical protein
MMVCLGDRACIYLVAVEQPVDSWQICINLTSSPTHGRFWEHNICKVMAEKIGFLDSGKYLGVVCGFAGEETNDGHFFDATTCKWCEESLNASLEGLGPHSVCISGSFPSIGASIVLEKSTCPQLEMRLLDPLTT